MNDQVIVAIPARQVSEGKQFKPLQWRSNVVVATNLVTMAARVAAVGKS